MVKRSASTEDARTPRDELRHLIAILLRVLARRNHYRHGGRIQAGPVEGRKEKRQGWQHRLSGDREPRPHHLKIAFPSCREMRLCCFESNEGRRVSLGRQQEGARSQLRRGITLPRQSKPAAERHCADYSGYRIASIGSLPNSSGAPRFHRPDDLQSVWQNKNRTAKGNNDCGRPRDSERPCENLEGPVCFSFKVQHRKANRER